MIVQGFVTSLIVNRGMPRSRLADFFVVCLYIRNFEEVLDEIGGETRFCTSEHSH